MIHVVHAANRVWYEQQLRQMHRLRWRYYIEERAWSGLARVQREPGYEYDEYDDDRAVYLLSLSQAGDVQGAMRIRPTDDKSLISDHFAELIDPVHGVALGADVWEISRLMRAPEYRGADGALRVQINCAACEFAMSRGIRRYIAAIDTFLLPSIRALNRDKHRVLGAPAPFAEGEMIGVEFTPDRGWLEAIRALTGISRPVSFELSPAAAPRGLSPMQEAALVERILTLSAETAADFAAWSGAGRQAQAERVA